MMSNINRRGFSLTELAIVLAVGAIIVGGIWSLAASAYENQRRQQAAEEVLTVVGSVRGFYGGQANVNGNGLTVMGKLFAAGAIPGDMIRNHSLPVANWYADDPWGAYSAAYGSFNVCGWVYGTTTSCNTGTGAAPYFGIELLRLSQPTCIYLAMNLTGSNGASGLVDANIGVGAGGGTSISALGAGNTLPVSHANAAALCTDTGTNNSLRLVYRLKPPTS